MPKPRKDTTASITVSPTIPAIARPRPPRVARVATGRATTVSATRPASRPMWWTVKKSWKATWDVSPRGYENWS